MRTPQLTLGGFCYTDRMMNRTWRIGIDCRLGGKEHAGIGRYIENLAIRLPSLAEKVDRNIEWVFFFHDNEQAKEFHLPDTVKVVIVPFRHYSLREQFSGHQIFTKEKLDLLHVPHFNVPLFYKGKMVVTIHDLLWHEYKGSHVTTLPMWQYFLKYRAYLFTVDQAIKRAAWILVPADTVKKTVLKYYPFAKAKVEVTCEGIASEYKQALKTAPEVSKAKREKQLVYVGSLYPHKNVQVIFDALKDLPDFKLILSGTRNVFQEEVKKQVEKMGLRDRVEFRGYLTDKELVQLYQESFALIQPSLSEGFGLTGVEAMAAGIPVVASQIPIFQEIYQDAAIYFDPLSSASFKEALHCLEFENWGKILEKGKKIASQYDWDKTASQTLQSYIRVLK